MLINIIAAAIIIIAMVYSWLVSGQKNVALYIPE